MSSLYTSKLYGPTAVETVPEVQALSNGKETIPLERTMRNSSAS